MKNCDQNPKFGFKKHNIKIKNEKIEINQPITS